MLTCPMCKKALPELARECPRCSTDLGLLVDYVSHRQEGLARAESLTRDGKLGDAVWAYLEVLEVDPDNAAARRQVGQVVTAVRQFDRAAPGQRWLRRLRRQERFRRWLESWRPGREAAVWLAVLAVVVALAVGFLLGYYLGLLASGGREPPVAAPPQGANAPRSPAIATICGRHCSSFFG
jgi:hypothetical protein